MIHTRLTDRFDLKTPIVSAPMAIAAGGALASAVTAAGGLGFIGAGYCDRDWIKAQFAVSGNRAVGCGFISWALEFEEIKQSGLLAEVLERKPAAVFFSFGDCTLFAAQAKEADVPVFAQVQTLAHAKAAVAAGADVIVAQGAEAGGHGASRGTISLVPEVVDAVGDQALVLAAGGIADGRGLAAALMLGADGVLVGTRFWASREALVSELFHGEAVKANGDGTVQSTLPDIARDKDWPPDYQIRTLRSPWIQKWLDQPEGLTDPKERAAYADAAAQGDSTGAAGIAGEAVGLIHDIPSAADIVDRMTREASALLDKWGATRT